MSYTSNTLTRSIDVLRGARVDFTEPYGPGETERCVETPFAAQTLAGANRVLDIGLAMSHPDYLGLLLAYLDEGGHVTGADIIRPERVQSRYPEDWRQQILDIPVEIGDVREMDFSSDPFDAVMCISTLEHIGFDAPSSSTETAFERPLQPGDVPARAADVDQRALAAFRKALKPGGKLCLTVPAGVGATRLIKDSTGRWAAYLEYGPEDWSRITSLPGFTLKEEIGVVETDAGWIATSPFDDVFKASVADTGLPMGCIMAVFEAV